MVGHNSRVRLNNSYGNGYVDPPDDFGIGLIGTASGNVIEQNIISGNTNGIYIAAPVGKNLVRDNTVVGNTGIQVSNSRPEIRALDIVNLAPATQIEFDGNQCLTALNAPCPAIAPR
jgi:parallel beta-helix repeat protein